MSEDENEAVKVFVVRPCNQKDEQTVSINVCDCFSRFHYFAFMHALDFGQRHILNELMSLTWQGLKEVGPIFYSFLVSPQFQ